MQNKIKELELLLSSIRIKSSEQLDDFKKQVMSKTGILTGLLSELKNQPAELKPDLGRKLNELKQTAAEIVKRAATEIEGARLADKALETLIDPTLPGREHYIGSIHPISQIQHKIEQIFKGLGFEIAAGPEIEDEHHNFEALNMAADHPARDMQDTFYLSTGNLLRTHTSPVQIRLMERKKPPIRAIMPGTVYRRDDDVSHTPMFHQVEGLMVDTDIRFSDLKGVLFEFLHDLFGPDHKVRLRPSYFPFTEPSAEVDISCVICGGKGCNVCKHTGWIEILGAGMVHKNVLEAVDYDSAKYTGFAFGMGIERIAMLYYGIDNIHLFFENDLKFLKQF